MIRQLLESTASKTLIQKFYVHIYVATPRLLTLGVSIALITQSDFITSTIVREGLGYPSNRLHRGVTFSGLAYWLVIKVIASR